VVQTVTKTEGATMTCKQCGTNLICRLKDYGGNYAPSLQWQNQDGNAHYKTTDGKNFSCNIPEDKIEGQQTFIPNPATVPGTTPPLPPNSVNIEILSKLNDLTTLTTRIFEMSEAIMRYTIDKQLRKNESDN